MKTTMEFPARSAVTSEAKWSWEEVKALLDKEHTRRAEYVTRLLMELRERFGDEVMGIARRTIYQIGHEKGKVRGALVVQQGGKKDLESLANLVAHKTSRLYGTTPEIRAEELVVRELYCPLPPKWKEMGFSDSELVELTGCRSLAERGCCEMIVKKKKQQ
jgi:hypothetical protein